MSFLLLWFPLFPIFSEIRLHNTPCSLPIRGSFNERSPPRPSEGGELLPGPAAGGSPRDSGAAGAEEGVCELRKLRARPGSAGWPEERAVTASCVKAAMIYATLRGEGSSPLRPAVELVASSPSLQPHQAACLWPVALYTSFHFTKSNN